MMCFLRRAALCFVVFAAFVLAAACVHMPAGGAVSYADYPPERAVVEEHRKGEAVLDGLPEDIRGYLLKLAAAFAAHDTAFLLAQGETEYEKNVKNSADDDEYLSLLYRAGVYAEDAEWQSPFTLDIDRVRGIDYTSWREQGPVLEVDGIIYMDGGHPLSFSVILLWRLEPPKILGSYP